jgi:hypothetical protein
LEKQIKLPRFSNPGKKCNILIFFKNTYIRKMSLNVPFLMPRVEETVPDYAMLKDRLTGASVVEERYTSTQVPSSGDTYAVGGTGTKLMIIRVANQNDYIDTSTMVLNFFVKANNPASVTQDVALDDHILCMVDTINVKVGGQTVEVINNTGQFLNALVQGSMPKNYYEQSGAFEGLYVYSKVNDSANSSGSFSPQPQYVNSTLLQQNWDVGNAWLTNGRYYSIPLTFLGLCRLPSLFAARNFQDITLEILFKSNLNGCVWTRAGVATSTFVAGAGNFVQISDVKLTYDCCRMSADYYALMDNELKMPNGSGVAYPIDTYQVQPATIPSAGGGGTNLTNIAGGALTRIVVAKGTRFLKGVYGVTVPTVALTSFAWRGSSHFGQFGMSSYQVVINSKRYPQLQIQTPSEAFSELQKAYNLLGSVASGSVINWFNYQGQPFARAIVGVPTGASLQDATVPQTKGSSLLGAFSGDESMYQLGINLEQFLTNQPDAGGINTSTSGYQIAIEINQAGYTSTAQPAVTDAVTANPLTHFVILHFTRVLTLKAGSVEVLD